MFTRLASPRRTKATTQGFLFVSAQVAEPFALSVRPFLGSFRSRVNVCIIAISVHLRTTLPWVRALHSAVGFPSNRGEENEKKDKEKKRKKKDKQQCKLN